MAKKPAIDDAAKDEALKKIIRDTVAGIGDIAPDEIPHKVKERIRGRVVGDLDIDAYISEAMENRKKKS